MQKRTAVALHVSLSREEAASLLASFSRTAVGDRSWQGRVTGTVEAREVGDEIEMTFSVTVSSPQRDSGKR